MAEDRIDSIFDIEKLTAEQQQAAALVRETLDLVKQARGQTIDLSVNSKSVSDVQQKTADLNATLQRMNASTAAAVANQQKLAQATQQSTKAMNTENGSLLQNIELRKRYQNTLNSYKASQKEDLALLKTGTINRAEYNKRVNESQLAIDTYKVKIAELNRQVKEQLIMEGRAGDAYKQLSAQYNAAALSAKNLAITLGAQHPETIKATQNAKALSDQLKVLDDRVGQNQRNVGNYKSAFAGLGKAFSVLRTAANILPGVGIGGIFLALGTGIAYVVKQIAGANDTFNEGKVSAQAYAKALQDVNNATIESTTGDITKLDLYRSILNDVTRSQEERTQALQAYNQIADEANKIDISQLNNLNLINDSISRQINLIEKRALSRAAENILGEKAEALLKAREVAREKAEREQITLDANTIKTTKNTNDYVEGIRRQASINDRIRRDENVKQTEAEFNAAKQALYSLIRVEGFVAEETKKKDEKKKKEKKQHVTDLLAIEFEILKARLELYKENDISQFQNEKLSYEERTAALIRYGSDSQKLIEVQSRYEIATTKDGAAGVVKIMTDRNNALYRLAEELQEKLTTITAKTFDVDNSVLAGLVKGISAAIQAAKKQADKETADAKKKIEDFQKALKEGLLKFGNELGGLLFDSFNNSITREQNSIQEQIDLLEEKKKKDIEFTTQSVTNAAQRADEIAVIEANAAAKRQELERRQRELEEKKAKFDKAKAVAQIIANTAQAITAVLPNLALSILMGAIGAVQLTRVLAQPIPKYAEGTGNHPGGLMWVGDGGRSERVIFPDGSEVKTPATDTLMYGPPGTKVIKDYATMYGPPSYSISAVDTTDELRRGFSDVVKAVKRIPQPIIHAERAWTMAHRQGNSFRNYLNRSI